jgi:hypothetical protein
MIPLSAPTMLSLKTTIAALVAALSVIATASVASALIPQAFAQNNVTAFQSNSQTVNVNQNIEQTAGAETGDDGTAIVAQDASQGFCLQTNQQNAAAGNDASNGASNFDAGTVTNSSFSVGKDCS